MSPWVFGELVLRGTGRRRSSTRANTSTHIFDVSFLVYSDSACVLLVGHEPIAVGFHEFAPAALADKLCARDGTTAICPHAAPFQMQGGL